MTEAAEIVRVATLMHKVDQGASAEDEAAFTSALANLDKWGVRLVTFAGKILEGKRYQITSDNPETFSRYRALAQHLGATVVDGGDSVLFEDSVTLTFAPPAKQ
jgi:hypothetical protein